MIDEILLSVMIAIVLMVATFSVGFPLTPFMVGVGCAACGAYISEKLTSRK